MNLITPVVETIGPGTVNVTHGHTVRESWRDGYSIREYLVYTFTAVPNQGCVLDSLTWEEDVEYWKADSTEDKTYTQSFSGAIAIDSFTTEVSDRVPSVFRTEERESVPNSTVDVGQLYSTEFTSRFVVRAVFREVGQPTGKLIYHGGNLVCRIRRSRSALLYDGTRN